MSSNAKNPGDVTVLVTGFGPFLDIPTNPTSQITTSLPPTLPLNPSNPTSPRVHLPRTTLRASYASIQSSTPPLITTHQPDLILHLGVDAERTFFAIERSAAREGYHSIPDVDRRVWTRKQSRELWGRGPEREGCVLDLEAVFGRWEGRVGALGVDGRGKGGVGGKGKGREKEKGKAKGGGVEGGKKAVEVRLTDEVGEYVCGFVYYLSLLEMGKRDGGRGRKDVLFCHVPLLEGEEIEKGTRVVEALIRAMVEVWKEDVASVGG